MQIHGLQKMTLLDYPGKVACTVFIAGCNYACPYCHNSQLQTREAEPIMQDDALLSFLQKRQGLLDGVCITGGEPTLNPELPQLLARIKALGYAVKLDTNGSRPEVLRQLVTAGLVDYVAMDVKNGPEKYAQTAGVPCLQMNSIEESLRFLISGRVPYELRTTLVQQLHDEESITSMGRWLAGLCPGKRPEVLHLQSFVDRESVVFTGLSAPEKAQKERFLHNFSDHLCRKYAYGANNTISSASFQFQPQYIVIYGLAFQYRYDIIRALWLSEWAAVLDCFCYF